MELPTLRQGSIDRENATKQSKNMTLAGILTQAHDLSRWYSTHWATVSVGRFCNACVSVDLWNTIINTII